MCTLRIIMMDMFGMILSGTHALIGTFLIAPDLVFTTTTLEDFMTPGQDGRWALVGDIAPSDPGPATFGIPIGDGDGVMAGTAIHGPMALILTGTHGCMEEDSVGGQECMVAVTSSQIQEFVETAVVMYMDIAPLYPADLT